MLEGALDLLLHWSCSHLCCCCCWAWDCWTLWGGGEKDKQLCVGDLLIPVARREGWRWPSPRLHIMGNAGSMDSNQTDFRAHNMPLKLPMPEPGELEERFAIVLVSALYPAWSFHVSAMLTLAMVSSAEKSTHCTFF